jgi:hypothetical protein
MPITDELLWRAIEGALGAHKRAFLQNAPLTAIIGQSPQFALPQALHAIAATGHQKQAEAASIQGGLQALALVAKDASVPRTEPFLKKVARTHKLRVLEFGLSGGEKQAALHERRQLAAEIMETVKTAGTGKVLSGIVENPTLREAGKKMLGGGAVAAGAALPAVAVGSHLSDKFTEDARNRALQTAGGVAGIGLLGYGAKSMMDQAAQDRTRDKNYGAMEDFANKMSSEKVSAEVYAAMHIEEEKVAHMTTCVYVDALLASKEQTHKVAAMRDLNNEFLVELLATSVKVATNPPLLSKNPKAYGNAQGLGSNQAHRTNLSGMITAGKARLDARDASKAKGYGTKKGPGGVETRTRTEGPGGATK